MLRTCRLMLAMVTAACVAVLVPLAVIVQQNPHDWLRILQREWRGESSEYHWMFLLFALPAVINAAIGHFAGPKRNWAIWPLSVAVPIAALVRGRFNPKILIVMLFSLAPASVIWLAGRIG